MLLFVVCLLFVISCKDKEEPLPIEAQVLLFFEEQGLEPDQSIEGVIFARVGASGSQAISNNDVVGLSFEVSTFDGAILESVTFSDQGSQKLLLGTNSVYPFLVESVLRRARLEEQILMVVLPSHAYQSLEITGIDKNEPLVIRCTVESIQSLAQINLIERQAIQSYINARSLNDTVANPLNTVRQLPNGLFYKRVAAGMGSLLSNGDTATLDARIFAIPSNTEITALGDYRKIVGENTDFQGLEEAIKYMQEGERALFLLPSSLAYRESVFVFPSFLKAEMALQKYIPGYATQVSPFTTLGIELHVTSRR